MAACTMAMPALGRAGASVARRVWQLDADMLDEELITLLRHHVGSLLQTFGGDLATRFRMDIDAALHAIVCSLPIVVAGATYSQQLLGLKFAVAGGQGFGAEPSKLRLLLRCVGVLCVQYGWTKMEQLVVAAHGQGQRAARRLKRALARVEKVARVVSYINKLVFLYDGRYFSVVDRLCQLSLVPASGSDFASESFGYLQQELLWHGLMDLVMVAMPLVAVNKVWKRLQNVYSGSVVPSLPNTTAERWSFSAACGVCNQRPAQTPHTAQCGHVFCYFCIASRCEGDPGACCAICDKRVDWQQVQRLVPGAQGGERDRPT
eukprot:m.270041 g.270041  ORF g.270041 m.270041 type:complete len:319 (-) comp19309_c0_seq6:454-1410(-)